MKLHVGCGPIYIKGMFNIDLREDCKTDYRGNLFDLTDPDHPQHILEDSADLIWSCHMLEHLDYPSGVEACLDAFYGWMKKDGTLRLALPDLALVAGYYVKGDSRLFSMYGDSIDEHLYKKQSKAERFTFFMRGWEHTVVFDFELIEELMQDAGFRNITKMPFNQSMTGPWSHDRMPEESMYVEGTK